MEIERSKVEMRLIQGARKDVGFNQPARLILFSKSFETLILWLPLLAIPFFFIEKAFDIRWSSFHWNISSFIVCTFGLSTVHNFMTFSMYFGLPEIKAWRKEKENHNPMFFLLRVAGVSICLLLMAMMLYNVISVPRIYVIAIGILFLLFAIHHSFAQSIGLSQAYSVQILKSDLSNEERIKARRYQKNELLIKKILIPVQLAWSILSVLMAREGQNLFPYSFLLINTLGFILFSLMLAFLTNAYLFSRIRKTNKFWFSLRILLYALYAYAPLSMSLGLVFVVRLIHGVEYFGVYDTMKRNSKADPKTKANLRWISIGFVTVGLFVLLFRRGDGFYEFFVGKNGEVFWLIPLLGAISIFTAHMHFYLDGMLFRMKDPASLRWVSPLLLKDHPSDGREDLSRFRSEKIDQGASGAAHESSPNHIRCN